MTLRDEGLLPKRASGNGFAPAARSRTRHCGRQAPKDYADRLKLTQDEKDSLLAYLLAL
jgi:hypothetical protein